MTQDDRTPRTLTTRLATSAQLEHLVRSRGLGDLLDQFIAGETPSTAVVLAMDLATKGLDVDFARTTTTATTEQDAQQAADEYLEVVQSAHGAGLVGFDVSIALHGLGLALGGRGRQLALAHARDIAEAAHAAGGTTTVEMGPPDEVDDVLAAVVELRRARPDVGVTLQARLCRSASDLEQFLDAGSRVRLCKGAFPVGHAETFDTEREADRNFVRMLRTLHESDAYPMTATHDARLVSINHELVRRNRRTRADYEFQMLLGVRSLEHRRLVDTGRRLRVYLPFGRRWYAYIVHRALDNPRTFGLFARQLVNRR
ncbi:proline dehydrogenase family protein [Propionibacteriaceae bacterium G57]|uniref:proline dehydrogenase family protein n=1 Tax=Aestuariimicrobium sp. G57 TaxID=3418485 RepID=UPI003DA6DBDC